MASRTNHEANYKWSIDANTPWEKLRVITNFMTERNTQVDGAKIGLELTELKISKLEEKLEKAKKSNNKYKTKKIKLKIAKIKNDIPTSKAVIERASEECVWLAEFHAELTKVAEAEGRFVHDNGEEYNNEEMFEANYENELAEKHILQLKSDLLSTGRPSMTTAKALIMMPLAAERAMLSNLVNPDNVLLQVPNGYQIVQTKTDNGVAISYQKEE